MAIIHQASITPTKQELLDTTLGGPAEIVGSYRFDDPAGEVGVEGFVVRRGSVLRHVLLTYRGAPLDGAETHLVGTMEHSALGRRWVYDGAADPVAVACFHRALLGRQDQAALEIWADGELVGTREPTITLTPTAGEVPDPGTVRLVGQLDESVRPAAGPTLVATWDGGEAVIAELG